MLQTHFFITFPGKKGQIGKNFKKSCCRHQLQIITYFFEIPHIQPTFIFRTCNAPDKFFFTFSGKKRSNNKIFGEKKIWASTRADDPFFGNLQIWPTFIYRGEMPALTFAKLPVRALINGSPKNRYRHQLQPMTHFFTNHKFDLLSYFSFIKFLNLPGHALIHDPEKKPTGIN